jgi:hypothetical protein
MDSGMFKGMIKTIIITGGIITVSLGTAAYLGSKYYSNRQEIKHKMEWIADHNAIYGNKNGKLDLEEMIGIFKDINKTDYIPGNNITTADAKKYIQVYDKCTVDLK